MGLIKLKPEHRQFIISQRAQFVLSNTVIAQRLENPEYAKEHGFEPVKIHDSRISQILKDETDPKEITAVRQKWLTDFDDTPLAHKKARVQELIKLYKEADTANFATGKSGGEYQRKIVQMGILRQIKDEIGEDIDKLADALRAPVHLIIEERKAKLEEGLVAFGFRTPAAPELN